MRVLLGMVLLIWGSVIFAENPEILAEGVDEEVPNVQLDMPEKPTEPLLQNYKTDTGKKAVVVTPNPGEPYAIIPEQKESELVQQENQPTTESQWLLMTW